MDKLKRLVRAEFAGKNGRISAAIYSNGSRDFFNYGTNEPSQNSLYEIGSITKVFTALELLVLEIRGTLNRNDTIGDRLPELEFNDPNVASITLEQLATHTSGLPRLPDNMPVANPQSPYADYTRSHLYDFLSTHRLDTKTARQFQYSNLGYGVIGHILEIAGQNPLQNLFTQDIFQPLGMRSSYIDAPEAEIFRLQPGYDEEGEETSRWHFKAMAGAGGIVSSMRDMSLFLTAQIEPPETKLGQCIRVSQEPLITSSDMRKHGLGWMIDQKQPDDRLLWHNGQTGGYQSFIGFHPEQKTGVITLASCKGNLDKIAAEYFGII